MKKLFLQSGKLWVGEFLKEPKKIENFESYAGTVCIGGDFGHEKAMQKYQAAVSAAKDSAVEVVNYMEALCGTTICLLSDGVINEGQLYDIPEGWTVEIDNVTEEGVSVIRGSKYKKEGESELKDVRKIARLIQSGIVATGVPESGDNQKKYEEAAREYANQRGNKGYGAFLAGASFAQKEAHNAAIDKALTAMKIEWREDRHEIYNAIAKLKL